MNREELEIGQTLQTIQVEAMRGGMTFAEQQVSRSPASPLSSLLQLHYRVAMPEPESHLFEVTLQIRGWPNQNTTLLDLKMPVWTPGSYLVREYARHLQDFSAWAGGGDFAAEAPRESAQPLTWQKLSKNHWQVNTQGQDSLTICYRIYANELSVRTNHLDSTHGYFNGAALFFYIPGYEQHPIQVTITPPKADWHVSTALPQVPGQVNSFLAEDFDTLVDSPFEIGSHQVYEFEALGKPHQLAVWGHGNLDVEKLISDTQKIIQVQADLFGGLPYDRYLFLLHLLSQGFGGLEHKFCCSLIYHRFGFRNPEKYNRFLQLLAHEFFHLWNVKRIRPKAFEVFDYSQENYTPSLWFSEGATSYYDLVIPYRAGIYDVQTYLNTLGKEITRFLTTPGRRVQPLNESSFDAWVKLYRPDANTPNSQMSYYLKGEMVSLLLDLLIRAQHQNRRSLDDVMRQLWDQFGKSEIGFTPQQLQQIIEATLGTTADSNTETALSQFFHHSLETTEELPFDEYLHPFGLRLQAEGNKENATPYLGLTLKTEHGRERVKLVETGSPAQEIGLDAGDELLAMNGIRITADQLSDRLRDFQPGDTVELAFFHRDELCSGIATLTEPHPTSYQIVPVEQPSTQQQENFQGWLGAPLTAAK
jgi:predicted metalloprotease with PDZ domain